jgi:hypothetical protein
VTTPIRLPSQVYGVEKVNLLHLNTFCSWPTVDPRLGMRIGIAALTKRAGTKPSLVMLVR